MNLENKFLLNEIFEGRIDIAIFVVNSNYIFVFDDKDNFTIDMKPFYEKYFIDKIITREEYEYAIQNCRGGALELNKNTLYKYFSSIEISPKSIDFMKKFFTDGKDKKFMDKIYLNSSEYRNDLDFLKMKIPRFYINFDRKWFFHDYPDRFFEKELPLSWFGKYCNDLHSLLPIEYRYWIIEKMDFSKI